MENKTVAPQPFDIFGHGKDGNLILIPGLGGSRKAWGSFPIVLKQEKDFKVITYDPVGFGESAKELKEINLDLMVEQVKLLFEEANLDSTSLLSVSVGCMTALKCALSFSQQIQKLVLISPFLVDNSEYQKRIFKLLELLIQKCARVEYLEALVPLFFSPIFINNHSDLVKKIFNLYNFSEIERNNLFLQIKMLQNADLLNFDKTTVFKYGINLNIPTLIITGDRDFFVPVEYVEKIRGKFSNCKLEILKNCGHTPILEKTSECLKLIKDFI